ncbi:hypothetical protein [Tellurirhabdus rosea]|nr:hypothetical protein [Tellurirhabdus rosea]
MKKIVFLLGVLTVASLGSCARKGCPAYDSYNVKKSPAPQTRTV